ncbi:asparaginase [Barrientosiimonas marina]|uniref:Asparaginase n=1 Tax=Lentibacillus kimchii TaxID=1542911 RepID=A0ABW2UVU3_9BACI
MRYSAEQPIQVYRGNYLESIHDVHIAIVNASGDLLAYYGDASRLTFARSSVKPFQAVPLVQSGAMETFHLTERELALFCASHSGESFHREAVAEVLAKLDLQEDDLQCGTHMPHDTASARQLMREGEEPTPVYSNCSGKHTGMLAACVKQDLDLATYRDVSHPYQQQIMNAIADISCFKRDAIATSVDGCGVPVHRLPLYNVARAFANLAAPKDDDSQGQALKRINEAMTAYPEMVAGTKRFDTDLMGAFEGRLVAKGGAEGVHCFGDKERGVGAAIKIEDGDVRGTSVAALEVLQQLGIGDETTYELLADYHVAPVLNARKDKIGRIEADFQLNVLR